jgi:hypothetical protein
MAQLEIATAGPCRGQACDNCAVCRSGRCCRRDHPQYRLPAFGDWDGPIFGDWGRLTVEDDTAQCHCCGRRPHQCWCIPSSWRGTIGGAGDYHHNASRPPARRAGRPGRAALSTPGRAAVGDRVAGGTPAVRSRFLAHAADAVVREAEHAPDPREPPPSPGPPVPPLSLAALRDLAALVRRLQEARVVRGGDQDAPDTLHPPSRRARRIPARACRAGRASRPGTARSS